MLKDVEDRLLDRPWELGQPDDYGLYPIHYAAMNEHEAAPQLLEAILHTNRSALSIWNAVSGSIRLAGVGMTARRRRRALPACCRGSPALV